MQAVPNLLNINMLTWLTLPATACPVTFWHPCLLACKCSLL
jgi:hypothetical protein